MNLKYAEVNWCACKHFFKADLRDDIFFVKISCIGKAGALICLYE
jgi:hypothetical protein